MRQSAAITLLAILSLSLLAAPSQAAKEVAVEVLPTVRAEEIYVGRPPSLFCNVGNLNELKYAIGGFIYPPEDYALIFEPMAACSACPVGFDINTVHIYLQSDRAMDIVMSMDVGEVVDLPGTACQVPGPEICNTGQYLVSLPGAGLYDIGIPIDCPCLWSGWTFHLSVHFESVSTYPDNVPDLVTDEYPTVCTSWNDYGSGWDDLLSWGFPGNLSMYADAECCETSATEPMSWGQTKKLYR